ncbi:MAG TPA: TolC family protein [Puia sp.]|nr:TolC family protein [Puia sp.]
MNRHLIPAILALVMSLPVSAQKPTTTIPPAVKAPSVPNDSAVENRLIMLALNGPEYDASNHQNKINELELRKAKSQWLNLLALSWQVNDQTFKVPPAQAGQIAYVYPKYFFGVTIPLGIIFSQGASVKTAREALAYSKDQQQILAAQIKANILAKYKQFKLYSDLIEMENELYNDVLAMSTQAEENFKNGTITVEAYIGAQRSKNEELVKMKNLQLQQDLIRIDIERMIGFPLEGVLDTEKAKTGSPVRPRR